MEFAVLRGAMQKHFEKVMSGGPLFVVNLDKDKLWETYLETIPSDQNLIFRKRREFDCSCCRHFIKQFGNVVLVKEHQLTTLWDFQVDGGWQPVVDALAEYVRQFQITDVYLSPRGQKSAGTDVSLEKGDDDKVIRWNHFYLDIPQDFVWKPSYSVATYDTALGQARDKRNVFYRSLSEITMEALQSVMELVAQNSLYKGEEWKQALLGFKKHKASFDRLKSEEEKQLYAWEKSVGLSDIISKMRNHSMGTLLVDVSNGVDLNTAVTSYEKIVAPENYKRSKPIYTKQMLEKAKQAITDLGYLDSLQRRFACLDDITVNNVLFSNRDAQKRIQGGVGDIFEAMEKKVSTKPKNFDRVEEISIDKFMSDVLPTATEIEAFLEAKHERNLVSLVAPVVPDSKSMFKWNNNFSWAYKGNVTDSIVKQNVAKAGGNVEGVLRFSIQWNDGSDWDRNDEDAHCIEPDGNTIYYAKSRSNKTEGWLDVDITHPQARVPAVENIAYPRLESMMDGEYKFLVHCYAGRGGKSGFRAEIEFDGQIYQYDYQTPLKNNDRVEVAVVTLKNGKFSIEHKLPSNASVREVWGVSLNDFNPVSVVCYSPNYWDAQNGIGNRHWFFMLNKCVNDEQPNGWYPEFLNEDLYRNHRKVMEAMAYTCHVEDVDDQLSGVGFSSTLRNDLVVKVKGATGRMLKIKF